MPLISVIIPTYNCSEFISDAINSVLQQNFKNYEIIVVDDGSTDNTAEIIKSNFSDNYIKYIIQENKGPSAARNKGVEFSQGKYVCFLDADDILLPNCLSISANLIDKTSFNGALFQNNYEIVLGQKVPEHKLGYLEKSGKWEDLMQWGDLQTSGVEGVWKVSEAYANLLHSNFTIVNGATIHRDLYLALDGFNEHLNMGEDFDFFIRIALREDIYISKVPTGVYRRREGSNVDRREDYLKARTSLPAKYFDKKRLKPIQIKRFRVRQMHWHKELSYFYLENKRVSECRINLIDCLKNIGWDQSLTKIFFGTFLPSPIKMIFKKLITR